MTNGDEEVVGGVDMAKEVECASLTTIVSPRFDFEGVFAVEFPFPWNFFGTGGWAAGLLSKSTRRGESMAGSSDGLSLVSLVFFTGVDFFGRGEAREDVL